MNRDPYADTANGLRVTATAKRAIWQRPLLVLAGAALCMPATDSRSAESPAEDIVQRYHLEQSAEPVRARSGWREPQRILVGGSARPMIAELRKAAPQIEFVELSAGDSARQAVKADALIGVCTTAVLDSARSVQWIQLMTAGVENCVSIPAVRERNILVTNMQRIGGPVIAEHVMAMTLAFTRGLDLFLARQAQHDWQETTPPGRMAVIQGKTMLVVGLGGIGSEVARRAHALDMKVIATRASGRSGPQFVSYVGLPEELPKLAGDADVVVNTVPLTPQTRGMFDAAFFAKMKPSAYFINVARGGSVDTNALLAALRNRTIAGAALDVTDPEPLPPDHPLWQAPNLIITPHVAGDSDLGYEAQIAVTTENLRRYIAGEPMLSVVDVARGY